MYFSQQSYIKKLFKIFELMNAPTAKPFMETDQQFITFTKTTKKLFLKKTTIYQQLVGFLMYLMTQTYFDIIVSVNIFH